MTLSAIRSVARTIREQLAKTVRQPSRLFYIPLHRSRILFAFPRAAIYLLSALPVRWLEKSGAKIACLDTAYRLFQHDRPAESWNWLQLYQRIGPLTVDERLLAAMCLYHGLGRFRDAMKLFADSNAANAALADSLGVSVPRFRILHPVWARHIGHTATLDYVVKLGILEGRSREDTILYLPQNSPVANPFLLQQMAKQLRLVTEERDLPIAASSLPLVQYDYLAPRLPDGSTRYFWDLAGETYRRWHQESRGPLLTFPGDVAEKGWAALHAAGVPKGAWFVALHVREGKWNRSDAGLHGTMNSDIATYLPALAEIAARGGWVIRMGDPGMRRLPDLPNVIDYCHSELRADWMDIFIAACCRFMLGSASGPALIPSLFGVPCVMTNWWPPAQRPWHAGDIFMPKMLRRSDGRLLTLSESLREPFSYCHSRRYLADQGVATEDNSAEMIVAAVIEMLDRLDGKSATDAEVEKLRARSDQIYDSHGVIGMAAHARGLLIRRPDFVA